MNDPKNKCMPFHSSAEAKTLNGTFGDYQPYPDLWQTALSFQRLISIASFFFHEHKSKTSLTGAMLLRVVAAILCSQVRHHNRLIHHPFQ